MMLQWAWMCKYLIEVLFFNSLEYIPKQELLDHVNFLFNFLCSFHTVFHNDWIILYSHQQCIRVPMSSHLYQHIFLFWFYLFIDGWMDGWMDGWGPSSQVWGDILLWFWFAFPWWLLMNLFISLLPICISSLEKHLFNSFVHFKMGY